MAQNRDQPEIQLLLAPLKFMSLRISPRTSQSSPSIRKINWRHPGKFPQQFWPLAFFVYKYKTSAFITSKCCLKVKSARGNLPEWRIFGHVHKKRGQVFTQVGLPVDLYSVTQVMIEAENYKLLSLYPNITLILNLGHLPGFGIIDFTQDEWMTNL